MSFPVLAGALALSLCFSFQTKKSKPASEAAEADAATKLAAVADAEAELKERRTRARSLLISLSSDARTFNDEKLRARSLAHCANAFFQTAAGILLRPLPAPGQPDQSTAGPDGKYLVIKRLLPFFEESAPPAMVESLRGHLNSLNPIVSEDTRRRDDEWISKGVKPDPPRNENRHCSIGSIAPGLPRNATHSTSSSLSWLQTRAK